MPVKKKYVEVLVLTCTELGWDCVMGVYPNEAAVLEEHDDENAFDSLKDYLIEYDTYIIHKHTMELK